MAKEKTEKTQQPESVTVIDVSAVPEGGAAEPTGAVAAEISEPMPTSEPQEAVGIEALRSFVSEKFNQVIENDEELYAFVLDKLEEMRNSDAMVGEILAEYPELAAVVEDLGAGKPFEVALAANIDVEALKPLEDEEMYAQYEEARNARKERARRAEEHRATFTQNWADSEKVIADFFEEKGFTEEQATALAEKMDRLFRAWLDGQVTPELLEVFYRSMDYDNAVEAAREAGAIDAKNARIDAERERAEEETDGLPTGGSAMGVSMPEQVHDNDLFGEVARNSRKNW